MGEYGAGMGSRGISNRTALKTTSQVYSSRRKVAEHVINVGRKNKKKYLL